MKLHSNQQHIHDRIAALETITQEEAMELYGDDCRENPENGIFDHYPGQLVWDGTTHRRVDEEAQG